MPNAGKVTRTREVVYIYELAREHKDGVLRDLAFEDCSIVGPAVLIVLDDVSVVGCTFESPQVFWPALEAERSYFGAIGLTRCVFTNCRFERIGIAANRSVIELFLTSKQL